MGRNQKQKITICFHIFNNENNPRLRRSPTMFEDKRKVVPDSSGVELIKTIIQNEVFFIKRFTVSPSA